MMAEETIPHFQNDLGVHEIKIGAHRFNCCGASAPYDHPHVFLDMGSDTEIVCPYCSTLYTYSAELKPDQSEPAGCQYKQAS